MVRLSRTPIAVFTRSIASAIEALSSRRPSFGSPTSRHRLIASTCDETSTRDNHDRVGWRVWFQKMGFVATLVPAARVSGTEEEWTGSTADQEVAPAEQAALAVHVQRDPRVDPHAVARQVHGFHQDGRDDQLPIEPCRYSPQAPAVPSVPGPCGGRAGFPMAGHQRTGPGAGARSARTDGSPIPGCNPRTPWLTPGDPGGLARSDAGPDWTVPILGRTKSTRGRVLPMSPPEETLVLDRLFRNR